MSIDPTKYKNIIFDLGGVLLNIDYTILIGSFAALGLKNFEEYYSKVQQDHFFDLYEKGLISSDEFTEKLKAECAAGTTNKDIEDAWNSMLLDLPVKRMELLLRMKNTHRTFLLSNTNDIHIKWVNKYLQNTFQISDFSGYFEKVYLSYTAGMRKPDAEIFALVLQENGLDANETLFIDDSPQHIEGAKTLGIQTYWLDVKRESILDIFSQ